MPFLDHFASHIQSPFSDRNMAVLNGFYAFPDKVTSEVDWRPKFESYLEEITDDLPEPHYIKTELDMWEDYCRHEKGTPPATLSALLPKVNRIAFPNVFTALQLLATIPVTICSCERSIPVLRRLKTYFRNTMSQGRLNGLAMLHVHREINLDVKEVLDCFAGRHPRRMKLINILNADPNENVVLENAVSCQAVSAMNFNGHGSE